MLLETCFKVEAIDSKNCKKEEVTSVLSFQHTHCIPSMFAIDIVSDNTWWDKYPNFLGLLMFDCAMLLMHCCRENIW